MSSLPETLVNGQSFVFNAPGHEELWERLASQDPAQTAGRAAGQWLGGHDFLIELMNVKYLFKTGQRLIVGPNSRLAPDRRVALSLLNYLVGARETTLSGRLVPETVLPGGDRFFSGTHALARQAILNAYGSNGALFLEKAGRLGAEAAACESGSFSCRLLLLPKIAAQITLCEDDEEFPAELYFAFDASAADHVPLAIISALVGLFNDQMAAWQ